VKGGEGEEGGNGVREENVGGAVRMGATEVRGGRKR